MIYIGFDPGFERLGIAVIERNKDKERLLFSECYMTSKDIPFEKRLLALGLRVEEIIKKFNPKVAAIEKVFMEKNKKTAMHVAEVKGTISYICSLNGVIVENYSPLQIKQAIIGYGKADKKQMAFMIKKLLNIQKEALDDEYDAIATALTVSAMRRKEDYPHQREL